MDLYSSLISTLLNIRFIVNHTPTWMTIQLIKILLAILFSTPRPITAFVRHHTTVECFICSHNSVHLQEVKNYCFFKVGNILIVICCMYSNHLIITLSVKPVP